jgi:Protein of unknown function (DUF4238)
MPDNKRQHFVSKFYLKYFSPDTCLPPKDRKTINVFNMKRGIVIPKAGLKEQCYRDYFYGKDLVVEDEFCKQEGITQPVFSHILANRSLPPYASVEHIVMVMFVHMQAFRTEQAARKIRETDDKVNAEIMTMNSSEAAKIKALVKHESHVNASLEYSKRHFPLLLDLECKLLVAGKGLEFLTSDHPAVLYNQLFEFWDQSSHTGLASVGLQIYFPLSPKAMLVMYDSNVYHVGVQGKRIVTVSDRKDVRALNVLQVVNANKNLYFQTNACEPFVAYQQGKPYIRQELGRILVVPEQYPDGRTGKLIGLTSIDVKTNLKLSFVSVKKEGKEFAERYKAAQRKPLKVIRNEELWQDHDWFLEEVKAGRRTSMEFRHFLGKHFFSD